jgi:succinate dehydrogenase / fumarate reductase cytochrome b subunit
MRSTVKLWDSTVSKKITMAVTGLILTLFVLGHAYGNLKVYEGPATFNGYARGLRTMGAPLFTTGQLLWLVRVVLIVAVVLHIWAAVGLNLRSARMRERSYRRFRYLGFAWASKTMVWGGLIIFGFVTFHLMDLTFGNANPGFVEGDVYHNFVATFSRWPVSLAYIAAMIPLGLHVYHGLWSMFQTLGWNSVRYNHFRRPFAAALALAIFLVNVSFPLAVLSGIVHG